MKAVKVDGQDVEAVYKAARQALDYARTGKGPVFMHLDTVRLHGHYIGDPQVYRDKDEAKELAATRDPITILRERLGVTDDELAEDRYRGQRDRRSIRRVRQERHRPAPEDALKNVYA
jgi:TPP-dependent pyruvate/acetoin dehydrogenase alpha subunit